MGANDNNVTLEDVRIVFRNFAGNEGLYNRQGDREFSVVLDDETAEKMIREGWNIKTKPPREDGDENFNYLKVSVSFKGRPPRLVLVTSNGRTTLDEETCELLDWADLKTVDMILRPYHWNVNGKTGTKAYLHAIYATIHEDALEQKYRDVPEIGRIDQPALEQGFIDGEVISDSDEMPVTHELFHKAVDIIKKREDEQK